MVTTRSGARYYTRGLSSRYHQGIVRNRLMGLGRRAGRRWAIRAGTRALGYGAAAYAGTRVARAVAWKMRQAARNRRFKSRRITRGVRETHKSVQEIQRFYNQLTSTWVRRVFHKHADLTDAPQLRPMKPDTDDNYCVDFDITRQLFSDTTHDDLSKAPEIQANEHCKVDVAGICMTIELVNEDEDNDIYV